MQGPTGRLAWLAAAALAATALLAAPNLAKAVQTDAGKAPATQVKVETLATGLVNPWSLQFLPDGRMLVTERPGRLRIVTGKGEKSDAIPGVPEVYARSQGGLLDVRVSDDFASSGWIFLSYAEPREGGKAGTSVARAKLILEGDGGRLEDVKVIYRQMPSVRSGHHFGSRILPAGDGTLFVTTGDRGSESDKAQDPSVPIGKVLRITADGEPASGNPGLEGKQGWAPEVWSIGHRNVQGAAIEPATGALWTVEHGARGGDELNRAEKGKNYGWPIISYGTHYSGQKIGTGTKKAGLEQPVYYWDPSIATSGLEIYSGDLFAEWKGNFLVGGLSGAQLSRLVLEDGKVIAEEVLLSDRGDRIRDVRQGPDGAIYVVTDHRSGEILRLTPQ